MTEIAVFNQKINCFGRGLASESLGNAVFLASLETSVLTYLFQRAVAKRAFCFLICFAVGRLEQI